VRNAVIAPPGKTLAIADLNQIELRVASELSGDEAMHQIFRDGGDIHKINAEDFIGSDLEALPEDERETVRGKAKRIGFGVLYGSGARGLVASAWSMYRIDMSEAEAQQWKDRFYDRYPQLRAWQNRTANEARVTGVLRSVAGRPLRAEWEPIQPLKWTLCCNYPVQSSAADVMLLAMARVHAALEGLDAALILQIHDELVVECAEAEAAAVAAVLKEQMTAAYLELFPGAPVLGLVDVAIRKCWAKAPKAKREWWSRCPSNTASCCAPSATLTHRGAPAAAAQARTARRRTAVRRDPATRQSRGEHHEDQRGVPVQVLARR
jgi:DNA polymerase I